MKYFVSWGHGDPFYQNYFADTRVLVSPPNVNQVWHISQWATMPAEMIVDSGAYQYQRKQRVLSPENVLRRQLAMIADTRIPTGVCHLDIPLGGTRKLAELDRRITRNLENARWLMHTIIAHGLPMHVYPIGVIQGYTVERVYFAAQALADMGYTSFAVGSLAGMVASSRDELLRRVEAAMEAVGSNLHILGVSSEKVLAELARLGIASVDSSAPMHEAWRGGVFYSHPLRRYKLFSPHFQEWRRNYSFSEILSEPQPCDCPICQHNPADILPLRGKHFIKLRGVHNYHHLRREFEG
jgi:tRNA-guanine family transglycosylase